MIKSFKHKGLKKFFEKDDASRIHQNHIKRLRLILTLLHGAKETKDMNFPGSNLHRLVGDKQDLWSVRVSGNWRIVFRLEYGDVYDVDYLDYH